MGVALELKHIIETNLIRVSHRCINRYFHFSSCFKQLYKSNKTEHFNYKGGCNVSGHVCLSCNEKKSWLRLQLNGFGLLVT